MSVASFSRPSPRLHLELLDDRVTPANLPAGFTETVIADGLLSPIGMAFSPDGRLFVTEQDGAVRVIEDGTLRDEPFIRVAVGTASVTGEQGLLGIAFHPDFAQNQLFYLYYTAPDNLTNRLSRFVASGDQADPATEQILLEVPSGAHHNGGALHFGPDGKLYIATGDANLPNDSQSLTKLNGKLLRINPDGSIPEDNPFFTSTTGAARAIWAYGFRNPFTFAIHPETGRILVNDVGQELYEEVNDVVPGGNYGWPRAEGPDGEGSFIPPIYSIRHD
ncbi:MAG TPA: PQQ-dependent sugar dehydrogenase, partial [Gemmataceae bacterium]